MQLIPAIDIKGGRPVRLLRGARGTETFYGSDAVETALFWESEGAEILHVVDLDAAFEERSNREAVRRILRSVRVPVQVGGGVRALSDFDRLVEAGASRVVFGTAAIENPEAVRRALRAAPERVVIGVDVKKGRLAVRGWEKEARENPLELGRRWAAEGVLRFVYTDVERDGSLDGPNGDATRAFAAAVRARVIASGGIGALEDLRRLRELEPEGVEAAIVGKALYEGAFDLSAARAAAR